MGRIETTRLHALVRKHIKSAIKLRRQLHRYPELAFQETRTGATLKDYLQPSGLKISRPVAHTGFTAFLQGASTVRVIALRTDMDALPIQEKTDLSYKSRRPDRMHACGHDVHMSIVAGAARVLSDLAAELDGSVKFIFQPAEETPPGGARLMIEGGALESPKVDAIVGLHVDPDYKTGKIGVKDGPIMAGVSDLDLEIAGKSGHAAKPDKSVDALVTAAHVINQVQSVVSRQIDPLEPAVLTLGRIEGGAARNVIAGRVRIEGTLRTLSGRVEKKLIGLIERTCQRAAQASGASCRLTVSKGYPPLVNDPDVNSCIRRAATELFGKKCVVEIEKPDMAAEDFAEYTRLIPGAMFRLGIRNRNIGAVHPWHSERFVVDENAIEIGIAICTLTIISLMKD